VLEDIGETLTNVRPTVSVTEPEIPLAPLTKAAFTIFPFRFSTELAVAQNETTLLAFNLLAVGLNWYTVPSGPATLTGLGNGALFGTVVMPWNTPSLPVKLLPGWWVDWLQPVDPSLGFCAASIVPSEWAAPVQSRMT
jgi:hypothetical protein